MDTAPLGFALVLEEFSAGCSTVGTVGGDDQRMLRLHFTVQRHERGKDMVIQRLPPIYVPATAAPELPAAMLAALQRQLPHLAAAARPALLAALGLEGIEQAGPNS